jgi:hypothetical protein
MVNLASAGMPQSEQIGDSRIPPLESGDRLTRHKFEHRYQAMQHLQKAEFILFILF